MLTLSPAVRVFVVVAPLDMRGSFDALAGATRRLGLDPTNGHLYLFLNKRRRHERGPACIVHERKAMRPTHDPVGQVWFA